MKRSLENWERFTTTTLILAALVWIVWLSLLITYTFY